jgi:short subunit fatty acids transporter
MEIKKLDNQEEIIEKESFFSRYKIIEIICLLVIFSIAYKLLEPEYKNFKLNIEKVDTDFTIKSINENKKSSKNIITLKTIERKQDINQLKDILAKNKM